MAAIDYGVMCFLNGQQIYGDKLYPEIEFHGATIECYKYGCIFSVNGKKNKFYGASEAHRYLDCRKSGRYKIGDFFIHIKELCVGIYRMTVSINGEHLTIIYGYVIYNKIQIWNKIKVKYLGKERARIVDREIIKRKKRNDKSYT